MVGEGQVTDPGPGQGLGGVGADAAQAHQQDPRPGQAHHPGVTHQDVGALPQGGDFGD